ncbi:hypothetical protein SAMN05428962_0380 [Paenibacillus sp. BC26]|nr:hypothetical protein SAMN05428962_0380 [Paenibacillus sp. BC26]
MEGARWNVECVGGVHRYDATSVLQHRHDASVIFPTPKHNQKQRIHKQKQFLNLHLILKLQLVPIFRVSKLGQAELNK